MQVPVSPGWSGLRTMPQQKRKSLGSNNASSPAGGKSPKVNGAESMPRYAQQILEWFLPYKPERCRVLFWKLLFVFWTFLFVFWFDVPRCRETVVPAGGPDKFLMKKYKTSVRGSVSLKWTITTVCKGTITTALHARSHGSSLPDGSKTRFQVTLPGGHAINSF